MIDVRPYSADPARYDGMVCSRRGASGLRPPSVSPGFWHNFGDLNTYEQMGSLVFSTKAGCGMWPGPYGDHVGLPRYDAPRLGPTHRRGNLVRSPENARHRAGARRPVRAV